LEEIIITKKEFKGIITPIVTPFKHSAKQEIDEEKLRAHVNFLIENGLHGLFATSGTGEYFYLNEKEHKKQTEIIVDEVNNRVPVLAGAGSPGTQNAVKYAKSVEDIGADAIVVVGPYYGIPVSQEGIYQHYKTVGESVDIPVWVYNLTRVQPYGDISPEVIGRLANEGHIGGIKNSTSSMLHYSRMLMLTREKILSGEFTPGIGPERFFLPFLLLGGKVNVATCSNIAPRLHVQLYEAFIRGDLEKAKETHFKLVPLWNFGASPAMVKDALRMIGHDCGEARLPLLPLPEDERKKLRKVLNELSLFEEW
jgi:4-hydroxy-tetrahydrodipicolinate synthase